MAQTLPATSITADTAILNGSANPQGFATTVYFEWGTDISYGHRTPDVAIGSASTDTLWAAALFGLNHHVVYHFRAVATTASGLAYGADLTFTPAEPPVASFGLSENFDEADYRQYTCDHPSTDDFEMGRVPGVVQGWGLLTQRHIDLRTFNGSGARKAEHWVSDHGILSVGYQASLNHMPGLIISGLPTGITTITSATAHPVDLTRLGPDATLDLELPDYPLGDIIPDLSYVELFSPNLAPINSVKLRLSDSTNPLGSGNTHASWPLSALVGVDISAITKVSIVLDVSSSCTFKAMALRLLAPGWVPKDVDFDNWNDCLRMCAPRDGDLSALPVPTNRVLPHLWRAGSVAGAPDPRPIDTVFAAVFNTGSQTGPNRCQLNFRDVNGTEVTQLQLDDETQVQLDGPQPTLNTSALLGRTVGDLETQTMGQLTGADMEEMDSTAAVVDQSWISFEVGWGLIPHVTITRSTIDGDYTWVGTDLTFADGSHVFASNTYYLMQVSLKDTTARLRIYELDATTFARGALWFDSLEIPDTYRFVRRAGRMGFKATLTDGDAEIRSVAPEHTLFAEYRSAPMHSNTPVKGVRLYADSAPTIQLFESWVPKAGTGGTQPGVTADSRRSISGTSTRVDVTAPAAAGQGVISNVLAPSHDLIGGITDWDQTYITLALWFPALPLAEGAALHPFLLSSDGDLVSLAMPRILPNQWQAIRLNIPQGLQSGLYQCGITYSGSVACAFWIDEVNVVERTVVWSARPSSDDPWVPFESAINSDSAGVCFATTPASALQVRAQALRQNCVIIGSPKVIPIYSELGRLVWPEDRIPSPFTIIDGTPITVSAAPVHGTPTTFTSGVTTSPSRGIVNWLWSFGDGDAADDPAADDTMDDPVVQHTYDMAGTYTVSLNVTDAWGVRKSYLTSVAVT